MHNTLHRFRASSRKLSVVNEELPVLYISVLEAKDLTFSSESKNIAQTYCTVQYEEVEFVTNLQPVYDNAVKWNETFCVQVPNPDAKSKVIFTIYKKNLLHKDRKKGQLCIDIDDLKSEDIVTNWFLLDTSSDDKNYSMPQSPRNSPSSPIMNALTSPRGMTPRSHTSFMSATSSHLSVSDIKSPRKLNPMSSSLSLNLSGISKGVDLPAFLQLRLQYSASEKGKMNQLYQTTSLQRYSPIAKFLESCKYVQTVCVLFDHKEHLPSNKEVNSWYQIMVVNSKIDHLSIVRFLIRHEVRTTENPTVLFRNNTLPCKAMTSYLTLFGKQYLKVMLGPTISSVLYADEDLEVDPVRLKQSIKDNSELNIEEAAQQNMTKILNMLQMLVDNIFLRIDKIPWEIRVVLHYLSDAVMNKFENQDVSTINRMAISGFLFLRFICPALLTPHAFGLSQHIPSRKCSRTFMIISKIVQNLSSCNSSPEKFMTEANAFVERNIPGMLEFIEKLSVEPEVQNPTVLETEEPQVLWAMHTVHQYLTKAAPACLTDLKSGNFSNFTIPINNEERERLLIKLDELNSALNEVGEIAEVKVPARPRRNSVKAIINKI
jgi:hypothetical protein